MLGVGEIRPGDDLAAALSTGRPAFQEGDVVVVTQKIVSKAEGRLVVLDQVEPRPEALEFAARFDKDPRVVELVLQESAEILRMERGIIISRTRHGWVCANAGLDLSNVDGGRSACLLPLDPDRSADQLRLELERRWSCRLGLLISDSFGRPWRNGIVNVAIGCSGFAPLQDLRGQSDTEGLEMKATVMASADLVVCAAELAAGKTARVPAAVVRGLGSTGDGQTGALALARPREQFLFC